MVEEGQELIAGPSDLGLECPGQVAGTRGGEGTVNLMECSRNNARNEAGDTDGYAVAATPVTAAQV